MENKVIQRKKQVSLAWSPSRQPRHSPTLALYSELSRHPQNLNVVEFILLLTYILQTGFFSACTSLIALVQQQTVHKEGWAWAVGNVKNIFRFVALFIL